MFISWTSDEIRFSVLENWPPPPHPGPQPPLLSGERGRSTIPTYFKCRPKACWVSGKLKNWSAVRETHAEQLKKKESRKRWFNQKCNSPWASKNSSSELSSESRAMLCILHSEMLWRDGLTVKPEEAKGSRLIGGHVLYFQPLFSFLTDREMSHRPYPQSHAQTRCYINMQTVSVAGCFITDGLHGGQGWCVKSEKPKTEAPEEECGEHSCHMSITDTSRIIRAAEERGGHSCGCQDGQSSSSGGEGGSLQELPPEPPQICDVSSAAKNSSMENHGVVMVGVGWGFIRGGIETCRRKLQWDGTWVCWDTWSVMSEVMLKITRLWRKETAEVRQSVRGEGMGKRCGEERKHEQAAYLEAALHPTVTQTMNAWAETLNG